MFGSQVLDVVLGLVFVYFLLSIICTAAQEMIAALFSLRARNLASGIANLFADKRIKGLDELFYDHPLIKGLSEGERKPSYIPPHAFALAFLDGIAPVKGEGVAAMCEVSAAVNGLPADSELRRLLLMFLQQAGDDLAKFRADIETWFNDAMTGVSAWYKRRAQVITLILATLVTGLTNADTCQIIKRLSADATLRAVIAAQAQQFVKAQEETRLGQGEKPAEQAGAPVATTNDGPGGAQSSTSSPVSARETMEHSLEDLGQLGIPLGWEAAPKKDEWPNKVLGLGLTIFAISLGAPFWFDILNRISKMRSAGAVPEAAAKGKKQEPPT